MHELPITGTSKCGEPRAREVVVGVVAAAVLYTIACPPYDWSLSAWLAPGILLASTRNLRPRFAFLAGVMFAILIGYGITSWAIDATLVYFELNRTLSVAVSTASCRSKPNSGC